MRKLYRDFFRRLLPHALVLALFFCLGTALLLLTSWRDLNSENTVIGINMLTGVNCLFPMLAGAVLTCAAFSFLHRRDASDLYLSFPCTRGELFGAAMGAVLTWGALILAVSLTLGFIICSAGKALFLPVQYPLLFAVLYIGFVAVCGFFAAANALTGRRLYALIFGVILTWLPRIIGIALCAILTNGSIISDLYGLVLGVRCGWATTAPYLLIIESSAEQILTPGAAVWNVLLAGSALFMGRVLFLCRRGETAGLVAENRWLRRGITSVATLPLTLLICCAIVADGEFPLGSFLFCVGGAFVLFLILELIPERKLSAAFKALPAFALSLALAASVAVFGLLLTLPAKYLPVPAWAVRNVRLESSNIFWYYEEASRYRDGAGCAVMEIPYMASQIAEKDLTGALAPVIESAVKFRLSEAGKKGSDYYSHMHVTATVPLYGRVDLSLSLNKEDTKLLADTIQGLEGIALFPEEKDVLLVAEPGYSSTLTPAEMREVYGLLTTELTPEAMLDERDYTVASFYLYRRDGLFIDSLQYYVPYSCAAASDLYLEKYTRKQYAAFSGAGDTAYMSICVLPERGSGYGRFRDTLLNDSGRARIFSADDPELLRGELKKLTPYERGAEQDFRVIVTDGTVYAGDTGERVYVDGLCFTCTAAQLERLLGVSFPLAQSRM